MARKKLQRFRDNAEMKQVLQPSREDILSGSFMESAWQSEVFDRQQPLCLELGCGKGEYTLALARQYPDWNFLGLDIKGSRLWYGASTAAKEDLGNAAFLRTSIELIDRCFHPGTIGEIWITFPDPQIKRSRAKHRLTHPDFLERYRKVLSPEGKIHLKTDSQFLHGYTCGVLDAMGLNQEVAFFDIDRQARGEEFAVLHEIKTHYEQQFREEGKSITYLRFHFG